MVKNANRSAAIVRADAAVAAAVDVIDAAAIVGGEE